MDILDLTQAIERGRVSRGLVLINSKPDLRSGKRDDYMTGDFYLNGQTFTFRIWDKDIYQIVIEYGPGIYMAETVGSDFNGPYLPVRSLALYPGQELPRHAIMGGIPQNQLLQGLDDVRQRLDAVGVSQDCWELVKLALSHPSLQGRFLVEGAAVRHHDNVIGGLANHTTKMLRILAAILANNPELSASADLLTFSIFMHDIGKIFEYQDLGVAEYWFAYHRVRGIAGGAYCEIRLGKNGGPVQQLAHQKRVVPHLIAGIGRFPIHLLVRRVSIIMLDEVPAPGRGLAGKIELRVGEHGRKQGENARKGRLGWQGIVLGLGFIPIRVDDAVTAFGRIRRLTRGRGTDGQTELHHADR